MIESLIICPLSLSSHGRPLIPAAVHVRLSLGLVFAELCFLCGGVRSGNAHCSKSGYIGVVAVVSLRYLYSAVSECSTVLKGSAESVGFLSSLTL